MADNNSNAPVSRLRYPTDYNLKSIVLYSPTLGGSLDLKSRLVELNYFEDIYNQSISGQLVISDAVGILNLSGLNGTEFIKITLEKSGDASTTIDRNFRIFSVSDRSVNISNNFESYTINFCSEELLLSQQYRISKSYVGQAISDIIYDIATNFLQIQKPVSIEDTYGQYDFVLPNKRIFETINWLSTYAQPMQGATGTQNGSGADMLFYENSQGYFFNSLQTLYKQDASLTFFFDPKNVSALNGQPNINQDLFNAMKFEILDSFDTLGAINKGTFANRLITFDVLTRTKTVTDFNYNDYFNSSDGMNGSPLTNNYQNRYGKYIFDSPPQNMEAGVLRMLAGNNDEQTAPYIIQKPGAVASNIYAENYIPNRVAQIALANHTRVRITVPGNVEVCVGLTVNFKIGRAHV